MTDKPTSTDSMQSLKPALDEVASYRRNQAKAARRSPAKPGNFNGMLVFVIVLMAIMMGIGGYTLYEVQKKLDKSNVLLTKGQENFAELERRLNATGTDVSKTLESIGKRLDDNEHEIRKLWDVSNKRNKDWIQANEKAIKSMSSSVDKTVKSVDESARQLKLVVNRFDVLDKDMTKLRKTLSDESAELVTQITLVRGLVQDQVIELKGVARQMSLLTNRQKTVEEAIEAIDEHRRQLNMKISELQNEIRQLQQVVPVR